MMIDLARRKGVGLVATNDVHFLNADDFEAHNALCCISTGKKVTDPERMKYPPDVYLKSPEEMREMFRRCCPRPATIRWPSPARCNVELDLKSRHAPVYTPANGQKAGGLSASSVL